MYKACSLVLLAIIASLVIQSSATIEKSKIVVPFKNVTKIIRQYNCKVPHPTLVYIGNDLFLNLVKTRN